MSNINEFVSVNNLKRFLQNADERFAPNKNMEGIKSDGADGYIAGKAGLVPAPSSSSNGKFLRSDGTWAAPEVPTKVSELDNDSNFLTSSDLSAHTSNKNIHVTTTEKTTWNNKQNALTTQQINNINAVPNKANASDLTSHTDDTNIHVTTTEKTTWNNKANKATTLSGYGITDAYTKTQVDKKVSDLVNSAPETLDTLNELASALGNDPNFATTVANLIGTKANTSDLSAVATSGSYTDLADKPTTFTPASHTHGKITNDGKIGTAANKPLITTTNGVVTTGSFGTTANTFCQGNDRRLSDARTPKAHTHTKAEITDFPTLATVATSGSYNDLSNKPTIPTVNNATLTIQKNGTTVKTFTANASANVTANITVPTKVSDLTNDLTFIRKPDGLNGQILTQNNNEITSENPIQLLNLVNTQEELNNALSSVPLTLQDVFNNWYRFAHSTDTSQNNTTENGVQDALNGWYYDSSLNAIGNTVNTAPYVGFVSDKTYKNWYMKTKGIGTDDDDDHMSIIVAFMTDSNGYEHSLSVFRCGGSGNGVLTGTDGVDYSFALILDYNGYRSKSAKVLAGIASSQLTGSLWSKGSHISVRRNGNTITAKTSQFGSDNLNIEFTYTAPTSQGSLSVADYTNIRLMLNNKSKIGFGMSSQPGYFILEETEGIFDNTDIYDVLNNKVYTYNNGWVQNGTVSSKVLNLSRIYNEKTDKLFYYKDEEVYQLNTNSDLSMYVTKSELSSKANDSDVVHKSGNETITGNKIFSNIRTKFYKSLDLYHDEDYKLNTNPSEKTYQYVFFTGKSAWYSAFLENQVDTDGASCCNLLTRNTNEQSASVQLAIDSKDVKTFKPATNNDISLGASANKWKAVYATTFNGNLAGNADTATKATNNASGNELSNNIIKGLSVSGKVITYTKLDGSTGTITTQDTNTWTAFKGATSRANGTAGYVPAPTKGNQDKFFKADGTWATPKDTTYSVATTSANGLMSSTDKTKLDGIETGANKYVLPTASSTLGGVKTTSTVTSTSGLTACPIISGVVYYKDTNTDTKVTNTLGNTTKAYITGTTRATTNTGTQIFDSGVYLTTTAGQLHADIDFPITEAQVNKILGIS